MSNIAGRDPKVRPLGGPTGADRLPNLKPSIWLHSRVRVTLAQKTEDERRAHTAHDRAVEGTLRANVNVSRAKIAFTAHTARKR